MPKPGTPMRTPLPSGRKQIAGLPKQPAPPVSKANWTTDSTTDWTTFEKLSNLTPPLGVNQFQDYVEQKLPKNYQKLPKINPKLPEITWNYPTKIQYT